MVTAKQPYNELYTKPPLDWIWNGTSWQPPKGSVAWQQRGRAKRVYIQRNFDAGQTPPIAVIPGQNIPVYSPPTAPVQTAAPTAAPIQVTAPPTGTTTGTTTDDLLFGYPKNYVYIAGAGAAALIVILYLATKK